MYDKDAPGGWQPIKDATKNFQPGNATVNINGQEVFFDRQETFLYERIKRLEESASAIHQDELNHYEQDRIDIGCILKRLEEIERKIKSFDEVEMFIDGGWRKSSELYKKPSEIPQEGCLTLDGKPERLCNYTKADILDNYEIILKKTPKEKVVKLSVVVDPEKVKWMATANNCLKNECITVYGKDFESSIKNLRNSVFDATTGLVDMKNLEELNNESK